MSNRLLSKIESICGFQIKSHFPPFAFLIFLFTLTAPFVLAEKDFPEKANTLVSDFANMLSKEEHSQLERKLVAFNDSTSTQIAVVIMRSTGNYEISEYAVRLYNHWGIGQKDKNNGVLVLVAIEDRKVFINTGYGIEGVLPDALCKRIVENEIVPAFRAGMIYKGLDDATNSIMRIVAGEYTADQYMKKGYEKDSPAWFLILLFVFIFILISVLKTRDVNRYARRNNLSFWAAWALMNAAMDRSRGSWGSFSGKGYGGGGFGGGFGGFGGGMSGGGGAGGSW